MTGRSRMGRAADAPVLVEIKPWTVWLLCIALFVGWDTIAPKRGLPTASYLVWDVHRHPVLGPIVVGVWSALTWHLFVCNEATGAKARHMRVNDQIVTERMLRVVPDA